jgi:hypothetical protein
MKIPQSTPSVQLIDRFDLSFDRGFMTDPFQYG